MLTEFEIVRGILLRLGRGIDEKSPLAKALRKWMREHQAWLKIDALKTLQEGLDAIETVCVSGTAPVPVVQSEALADRLGLQDQDRLLLRLVIARARVPKVHSLYAKLSAKRFSPGRMLGRSVDWSDHELPRRMRSSAPVKLGLIKLHSDRGGTLSVELCEPIERMLDKGLESDDGIIDVLVGARQVTALGLGDFDHVRPRDYLVKLLRGAIREQATGVNVLLHGPPGTGKTELARVLAKEAGLHLHAVGELDTYGEEPTRFDRLCALQLAERMLASDGRSAVLFDELEDVVGNTKPTEGGWLTNRPGSKIFVNRLLETNKVPVIWTTNTIGNVDGAFLRRMSHVLRLGAPPPSASRRILQRIVEEENCGPLPSLDDLAVKEAAASTVLRVASRVGKLAGGDDAARTSALSLLGAMEGEGALNRARAHFDEKLINPDQPIDQLLDRLTAAEQFDATLLLSGPPGTGKTSLARHIARILDRPLLSMRSGEILSLHPNDGERSLAKVFGAARGSDAIVFIDEAEGLLHDRAQLRSAADLNLINEMLARLDEFPLPVIAATNFPERIDPAARRRFVHRVALGPVHDGEFERAYRHFFGRSAPKNWDGLDDLVLGDFALVEKRLRHAPGLSDQMLIDELRLEADAKRETAPTLGF